MKNKKQKVGPKVPRWGQGWYLGTCLQEHLVRNLGGCGCQACTLHWVLVLYQLLLGSTSPMKEEGEEAPHWRQGPVGP